MSLMSRKGVRVPNMCHRRRKGERPSSEEVLPMSFQQASGFRTHVTNVAKGIPGFRRRHRCRGRCSGFTQRVNDVTQKEMSPMSRKACSDSDDVSPMSRQGFRIHTTCQRCHAKRGVTNVAKSLSGFGRRVTDVAQSTFGLRTHVTDVVQQTS
ncbi:unnamed protein product [Heligmosomoides polygyrus]|uniref:Uncharacterized protein n=1 Tax=Heligmosomoides polygyrus TaxID=6339 RepID=A0A183GIC9_HELPZ|nr:unnamed protein product [Heligmosomoides polygyrus]